MTEKAVEKEEKKPDNMKLWNSVCTTDPAMTKRVKEKGGFTAICAQYQRKNATEQWGCYGETWGVKDLQWDLQGQDGAEKIEITLQATFWYPNGEFPLSVDIPFRVNGDTRKKLLTDLTTKALSMLGFNSDVFEGEFDDNKYVKELTKKTTPPKPEPNPEPKPKSSFLTVMADMNKQLGDEVYFKVLGEEYGVCEANEIKGRDEQGKCFRELTELLKEKQKEENK